MSEISARILEVVKAGLVPHLKKQGFRGSRVNYYRKDRDCIQVVTIQSSQLNHGDCGKFRINFGVHFSGVAKLLHGSDTMPKIPSETFCVFRPIFLFPDRWWNVDPATDTSNAASNLGTYWTETVWPWLQANKTLPDAATTFAHQSPVAAAAARFILGERDEAVRLVNQCIVDFETAIKQQAAYPASVEALTKQLSSVREWAAKFRLL